MPVQCVSLFRVSARDTARGERETSLIGPVLEADRAFDSTHFYLDLDEWSPKVSFTESRPLAGSFSRPMRDGLSRCCTRVAASGATRSWNGCVSAGD